MFMIPSPSLPPASGSTWHRRGRALLSFTAARPRGGVVRYDNFQGYWGNQEHLDRFLQLYAVETAKLEARKKGYPVSEQALQDGSIKVQIIEGV